MFGNLKKTLYISCIRLRVKQLKQIKDEKFRKKRNGIEL
jgi:hypothetical protein